MKSKPEEMFEAINKHDIKSLQKLLVQGADAGTKMDSTKDGFYYGNHSLLAVAATAQFVECVEALLKSGANANFCSSAGKGGSGRTALYDASNGSNEEEGLKIVDLLLKAGADPNEVGNDDNLPLGAAARCGHMRICQRLIEAGATYKTWPAKCASPLVAAAIGGRHGVTECQNHDEVIKLLLNLGTPVDATSEGSNTALAAAAYIGNEYRVNWFLKLGANPNYKNKYDRTPLINAALYYQTEASNAEKEQIALRIIKRLLEAGADPTLRDIKGRTASEIIASKIGPIIPNQAIINDMQNHTQTMA